MTKSAIMLFGTITVAALAIPAIAQPAATPRAANTMRHDTVRTRAAIPGEVQQLFARLDANRDGLLTRQESRDGREAMRERRKQHATRKAAVDRGARRMAVFDRLDANRDGMISRDEFARGQAMHAQRKVNWRRGGMHLGGRMFDTADVNKDGRVSLQEATNAAVQHFDRFDTNRDGQLTPDERRAGRKARRD